MTIDLFTDITDEQKFEEYRAWTTRALLREYLGVLSGTKGKKRELGDILNCLPNSVFKNPDNVKTHLILNYLEQQFMTVLTDQGLHEGLATMEKLTVEMDQTDKKRCLENLCQRFYTIATEPLPSNFNEKIYLKGQEKTFPSFEQRVFAYYFKHYNTRLLTADTGMGKSGAAYLAMEGSDCERVLIIGPALGKATWKIEEEKLFQQSGNVYSINGAGDIPKAIAADKKYTVVSQELLGLTDHDKKLSAQLEQLIDQMKIDGAIIDEIDNLNNTTAISTKQTVKLLEKIRHNYEKKTGKSSYSTPVIGLTATPIRIDLADLNSTMHSLYPNEFALTRKETTKSRKTFSDTHLNRPDLAYYRLIGEKKMFRWEKASDIQAFTYTSIPVALSPFEHCLYDFIVKEVGGDALRKIRLLEDALFNPLLVKVELRHIASHIPEYDIDAVMASLVRVVDEWKRIKGLDQPKKETDYLTADTLVELGFGEIVLSCFFSEILENGIDTLVDAMTDRTTDSALQELRRFWKPHGVSSKYAALKKILEDALNWKTDENGRQTREKVFIVSPARKQGRTGDVLQRTIQLENGQTTHMYAPYELDQINDSILITHLQEWVAPCCASQNVLMIDGGITVGKQRDAVINAWVNDPDNAVLLATFEAVYQSRDYTLSVIDHKNDDKSIKGVQQIILAPPWHYQQLKQIAGRMRRHGQIVPVDVAMLESVNTVNEGKREAIIYSYFLSRMALSGIALTPEEKSFFDSKRVGSRIPLRSKESRYLLDTMISLRGAGEEKIERFLNEASEVREEITNAQLIAEKYFDHGNDEYQISGYNAELVSYIIKNMAQPNSAILSIGAGTLLLQRKLQKGIDNIDINPYMMEAGWEKAEAYGGRTIVAKASRLAEDVFPSGQYDVVDCSFMLNWSKLGEKIEESERIKILSQIHRVLKEDGVGIIALPKHSLTSESIACFTRGLHALGFTADNAFTGKSYGRNRFGLLKRIGWSVVICKTHEPQLDALSLKDLMFENEKEEWVSYEPKNNKKVPVVKQEPDFTSPHIHFDQYEIVNDQNETIVLTYETPIEVLTEQDKTKPQSEVKGIDFLQETKADYRTNLIKPVMKLFKISWGEAETLCEEIMKQAQEKGIVFAKKDKTINYIVREAQRIARSGRSENQNGGSIEL